MSSTKHLSQGSTYLNYDDYPNGSIIEAKYPGWKYWRTGWVEVEHTPMGIFRSFHCKDSKGKPTFYQMTPMALYRFITINL